MKNLKNTSFILAVMLLVVNSFYIAAQANFVCYPYLGVSYCLSGEPNPKPLTEYTYTVAPNFPSNWTNISYSWISPSWLGSGGSFIPQGQYSVKIKWGTQFAPVLDFVQYNVSFIDNETPKTIPLNLPIQLKGIPSNFSVGGPVNAQRCCNNSITYQATNFGNADMFNWTVSSGNTIVSGQGTNVITVNPNAQNNIQVTCVAGMNGVTGYSRTATFTTQRTNPPAPTKIAGAFPQSSLLQDKVCRNGTYTFSVNPICGATHTWMFPASWSVTNRTGNTVTFTVGNAATTGNILVIASFAGGCTATSTSFPIEVLLAPPTNTPDIGHQGFYDTYHCGKWRFTSLGGVVRFSNLPANADEIVCTVTSPWYFEDSGTTSITVGLQNASPNIICPSQETPPGTFTVRFKNCAGVGPSASISIYPDHPYWWQYPYPVGYACAQPPCNGCPPYQYKTTDAESAENSLNILPNFGNGDFRIELPYTDLFQLSFYNTQGVAVAGFEHRGTGFADLTMLPPGLYFVTATGENHHFQTKILITQ